MTVSDFYQDPEQVASQGDIFETVPHLFLKERPKQIELKMANRPAGRLVDELGGEALPKCGSEVFVPAPTKVGYAVLLTHGCEVDKDKNHRVIALVRQFDGLNQDEQDNIRGNGKYACFHLPALTGKLPESYVDFRRISTVGLGWLSLHSRPTALSEVARQRMLLAMFRFFARLQLDDDVFEVAEADGG